MEDPRDARIAHLEREVAAVRQREQDLTDFIENACIGLHWVGPDGLIIWANQAELDLLGYTREEYLGHHIAEFHADSGTCSDILRRLGLNETLRDYEARLRCKDGSVRHVRISSNVRWVDGNFAHTRCFTRDISESKRHEQRLLTQYDAGRILAESSSFADAAPALLRAACQHLGWRAGLYWEHGGDHLLHCLASWEDAPSDEGHFTGKCGEYAFAPGLGLPGRVLATKSAAWSANLCLDHNFPRLQLAAEYGLRSAFAFPLMLGETVLGVMEFFGDHVRAPDIDLLRMATSLGYQLGEFLERTRTQQRLEHREESYRVLTETAPDAIITIDSARTILFANAAAARLFGHTTEELTGSDAARLAPERLRSTLEAALAAYLQTGHRGTVWQAIPFCGEHRYGHEIAVEASIGEFEQAGKRLFVGIIRDITERKKLDEKLRHTAKLESLGVLAGGIAHDFNNLLTGILGNISLALEIGDDASPVKTCLEDAIEASQRAANLTRQLLAYAGKGRFVVEPIEVSRLVREISTLVRSSISKHVSLRLDLEDSLPPISADAAQLQQLVMNLVINAAEAIPEHRPGTVLVLTRRLELDNEQIGTLGMADIPPGRYIMLSVHDNGSGMDEATMARIFDPFFTTKFTGRGLGLAAAQGIVRGHKGFMKVFSMPGEGTTFRVMLPVSAVGATELPVKSVPKSSSGHGSILVIDDEPVVRKTARASLERFGYTVIAASDGREGLARFRQFHSNLLLVILDVTMPVMNGEDTLRQMRLINGHVPVLLSSGHNESEAVQRFSGLGLAGFIQKPYSAAALAEKVSEALSASQRAAAR